jgi:hypothetical protein
VLIAADADAGADADADAPAAAATAAVDADDEDDSDCPNLHDPAAQSVGLFCGVSRGQRAIAINRRPIAWNVCLVNGPAALCLYPVTAMAMAMVEVMAKQLRAIRSIFQNK